MENERRETLIRLMEIVFEKLAFMFTEEVEMDELVAKEGEFYHSIMGFKGSFKGTVEMAMPVEMSFMLAANILGVDDEEMIKNSAVDAVKELLNIYCGQMLTTLYGTDEIFDLVVPEVNKIGPEEWNRFVDNPETIGVKVENLSLLVLITI